MVITRDSENLEGCASERRSPDHRSRSLLTASPTIMLPSLVEHATKNIAFDAPNTSDQMAEIEFSVPPQ